MRWKAIGFEQKNLAELPIAATNPFRIIEEDGRIGVEHYFTLQRRIIIPADYNYIEQVYVKAGIFFIVGANKKYGVYNSEGELVVDVIYDKIWIFDTFILVRSGSRRGAYDFNGKNIVPVKYAGVVEYYGSLRVTNFKGNIGLYDYDGNHIVPDQFVEIQFVSFYVDSEKYIFVKSSKECNVGLYNKKGQVIVPTNYNSITLCEKFIIAETSDSDYTSTVYDYEGNVILPVSDNIYHNWNGIAIWYLAGDGVIVCDEKGKEFEPGVRYQGVFSLHDDFFAVQLDGKWKVLLNR